MQNHSRKCLKFPPKYIKTQKNTTGAPAKNTSSREHVLLETLQSVQSVELFNFKRDPGRGSASEAPSNIFYYKPYRCSILTGRPRRGNARERQGTPRSAWERFGAPANAKLPFFATPDAPSNRKCLIPTEKKNAGIHKLLSAPPPGARCI